MPMKMIKHIKFIISLISAIVIIISSISIRLSDNRDIDPNNRQPSHPRKNSDHAINKNNGQQCLPRVNHAIQMLMSTADIKRDSDAKMVGKVIKQVKRLGKEVDIKKLNEKPDFKGNRCYNKHDRHSKFGPKLDFGKVRKDRDNHQIVSYTLKIASQTYIISFSWPKVLGQLYSLFKLFAKSLFIS